MEKVLNKTAAITGVIGSGKSKLCSFLKELGAGLVSADEEAHQVLEDKNTRELICEAFALPKDFSRDDLGKVVFSDQNKLQKLNQITHPLIRAGVEKKLLALSPQHEVLVYDVPLYFESGLDKLPFRCSVVVFCDEDLLVKRIKKRDPHLTEPQILKRIQSQIPINKK